MITEEVKQILDLSTFSAELKDVATKVLNGDRISTEEALVLYQEASLGLLGSLASLVRERKSGDMVYFVKNFHVEPTNICVHHCRFCSYRRSPGQQGGWALSSDEILEKIGDQVNSGIQELHMVGGTHPDWGLSYYADLLQKIHTTYPQLHIKAFTAIEVEYMARKEGVSIQTALEELKKSGLCSLPGGGAEIFDDGIRKTICPDKASAEVWLDVHEKAHQTGLPTNATMLYGHIEKIEHRIDHLDRLRNLQDRTNGFNCFIPLKFRKKNNEMEKFGEVSTSEDLKNYAFSRIFLDNFKHVKAYWPMIGKEVTSLSLGFGVDDIDGTIEDSTRIYSMAGAKDDNPVMTKGEMVTMIKNKKLKAIERDAVYNIIQQF